MAMHVPTGHSKHTWWANCFALVFDQVHTVGALNADVSKVNSIGLSEDSLLMDNDVAHKKRMS
jgi:hypothetical protein